MPKIYTSHYPPIPIREESIFTNILQVVYNDIPSNAPAFIDGASGRQITRAELKSFALSMAYGLTTEFARVGGIKLRRGDVIMVLSPNSLSWPIILWGGLAAGICMTFANPAYTSREIEYQWRDSNAKAVIVHPNFLPAVLETFKHLNIDLTEAKRRIILADWDLDSRPRDTGFVCMTDLLGKGSFAEEEKFPGPRSHDTAVLCYSSGTTGKPKGVETTHRNLVNVLVASDVVWPVSPSKTPVTLAFLPFYHMYAVAIILMLMLRRGIPVVIMQQFDPSNFCRYVEKYRVTQAFVVPPVCLLLTHHPDVDKYSMKSLELLFSAAAPLGSGMVTALIERMRRVGANIVVGQGYGLTETSPTITCLPLKDSDRKVGSVGVLLPSLECRLVGQDGNDVKEGEPGELWARGPNIMKGYLGKPEATKNAVTEDGWFKTGDIVVIDSEGFYYVVDRLKELIKYKGFQVPPAELESVLLEHPDIVDAGVVGIDSEAEATELPRAYIVLAKTLPSSEHDAFAASVQTWIQSRVARHKYLRGGVVIVPSIPKSAAGKILRRELRERAKQELAKETRAKL